MLSVGRTVLVVRLKVELVAVVRPSGLVLEVTVVVREVAKVEVRAPSVEVAGVEVAAGRELKALGRAGVLRMCERATALIEERNAFKASSRL